jgi:hypothetical protein
VNGSPCLSTVPVTEAMQITVSNEMEKRMDESNSTALFECARGGFDLQALGADGHKEVMQLRTRKKAGSSEDEPAFFLKFGIGG